MKMVFDFIQTACVIIVIAYILSRANFFASERKPLSRAKTAVAVPVFLFIALYGQIVGARLTSGMVTDTRVAGVALAGLLFGWRTSLAVLLPTAAVSAVLGGAALPADLAALAASFALSSFCHRRFPDFDAVLDGIIVGALEVCHMLLIVALVRPVSAAKEIVYANSFPMIVVNGLCVIAFVLMISDIGERRRLWEKESLVRSESATARRIQQSLLENDVDIDARLELSAYLTPAFDVGGDLYSYLITEERYFKFILGDVSGKGVPAAITMSRCETLFQELARNLDEPESIMESLNERLCRKNKAQMFVTAVVGVLDLETGALRYANAGHTPVYLAQAEKEAIVLPQPKGMALGIRRGGSYAAEKRQLLPGQYVFAYTDGITEAENPGKELFGDERLSGCLSGRATAGAEELCTAALDAVRAFAAGARQSDDIAVFCFGRKGETA